LLTQNKYLLNIFNYNLYKHTNKTYIRFVNDLLEKIDFKKYDIRIEFLDKYSPNKKFCNEMFVVKDDGNILFLHKQNLIHFAYEGKASVNAILNVNIKNQKTYEVIKVLEILQKDFLITNNLMDIKYISHLDILKMHKEKFGTYLTKPLISLILNSTRFKDKNNNTFKLTYLSSNKHFIYYIRIKRILNIHPYASDKFIKKELHLQFGIDISIVQIFKIRKRYFIPNKAQRHQKDNIERFEEYFTKPKLLTNENLVGLRDKPAVYELLSCEEVNYNYKYGKTIYIGSTKNLYKRLNEYVNKKGHTDKMKEYLLSNHIYFRIIKTKIYKRLETVLLNRFIESHGELPLLNSNISKK